MNSMSQAVEPRFPPRPLSTLTENTSSKTISSVAGYNKVYAEHEEVRHHIAYGSFPAPAVTTTATAAAILFSRAWGRHVT